MKNFHADSQKRIYQSNTIYFVTINTHDKFSYFEEEIFCDLFIKELELTKELKDFLLFAFVIIPDHTQMLIKPKKYNISQIMKSLKENFSRDANKIIENREGATPASRLQKQTTTKSILLLQDKINHLIPKYQKQFLKKYGTNQTEIPSFYWQKSFHDHIIRGKKDLTNHINYTHNNAVKHGLVKKCEEYKYSSYKNFQELIDKP